MQMKNLTNLKYWFKAAGIVIAERPEEKQKSGNNRKNKSQSNKDQWWKRRLEKSIKEWWKDVSKLEEVKKGNKSSMLEKEHM